MATRRDFPDAAGPERAHAQATGAESVVTRKEPPMGAGTNMKRFGANRRLLRAVAVAAIVTTGIAGGASAGASPRSQRAFGTFTSRIFNGPGCSSPVDLCSTGRIMGTFNGALDLVATSMTPTPAPGVTLVVGDAVIRDARGVVRCTESILLDTTAGGDGEFSALCEITGGTGRWAGASGYLHVTGNNVGGTQGSGFYSGKVVLR